LGDDTLHTPLPYYDTPDYISSSPPAGSDDTPIDLVFVDFIASTVVDVLNGLQTEKKYTMADVGSYSGTHMDTVLGVFASAKWN
jgi:hypothetical protein